MKRIISFILATVMCIFSSIAVSAESNEISFSMITNTGIVNLKATNELNMVLEPDVTEDDSIIIQTTEAIPNITSVKLTVTGEQYSRGYMNTSEYEFTNYYDANCTDPAIVKGSGDYWKLDTRLHTATTGQLLTGIYSSIYSMNVIVTGYFETYSEKVYYDWGNTISKTDDIPAFRIVKDFTYYSDFTDTIAELVEGIRSFSFVSKEVRNDYSYLPNTDFNRDGIITRDEVACLSYSELGTGWGIPGFEGLASQIGTFFNKQNNGTITFQVTTAPATFSNVWVNGGVPSTQIGFSNFNGFNSSIMGLFFNYETTGSLVSSAIINGNGEITFDISNILNDIGSNSLATIKSVYYGLVGGSTYKDYSISGLKIEKITLSYENNIAETTTAVIEPIITATTTVETTAETTVAETTTTIDTATTTTEEIVVADIYEDDDDDEVVEVIEDEIDNTEIVETTTTTTTTVTTTEPEIVATIDEVPIVITTDTVVATNDVDADENPKTGVGLMFIAPIMAVAVGLITSKRK